MGTAAKGGGGGEVVQVHGGHIIRSTAGKKDRHSKVYTAKGPRDRRVRLAAHTAIQFYDVQDRLGFDRPSKAVDWLMEKAKHAIDKLARLPPFDPNAVNYNGGENLTALVHPPEESVGFGGSGYPHRDLCLSLQSFQNDAGFEPETAFPVGFGGGWAASEASNQAEMGRFSRMLAWNDGGGGGFGGGDGERATLQSNFQCEPSIRSWDNLRVGPTRDHLEEQQRHLGIGILESDRFTEFCVPEQMGGDGGGDVHGMMVAHHHRGASSMSTTTDSSH
ncbi:hypothetical protein V2J09_002736 [Rumex salicifolius]